jgi:membrane-bound serine protease (ClpP class)
MTSNLYILAFLLAIALPSLVILFFVTKLALHSRRIKRNPSAAGLMGLKGRAQSEISNEGLVFVRGELWPARSKTIIQCGETVFVKGFQGLALEVEPL